MLQDWKSGIRNNNYGLDDILNMQQTAGTLNNMGAFGNNTTMSNIADKFNTWGNNGEGGGFFGGGEGGASPLGYIGIAQNGLKGLQEGLNPNEEVIAGGLGNGFQGFFGSNDYDNDIAQAIAGTSNGAKMGSTFGPWGAAIGGVLGLGSSFLDDL